MNAELDRLTEALSDLNSRTQTSCGNPKCLVCPRHREEIAQYSTDLAAVRRYVDAAEQEAKDCKTIQEWQAAYKARRAELRIDMYFTLLLSQGTGNWSMPFDAIERAKAVHDAAEWIRKEGT